ncbi:MAG: 16S rRNA (cytosine(967)-C(5))-methyltransferase RsmB [Solirubrobacteraceae bacterium]|nr:16S rRNA (cytosine(967)-C(5))-methyltransferase RsmB [Solirubrobacteraceae bacterium]
MAARAGRSMSGSGYGVTQRPGRSASPARMVALKTLVRVAEDDAYVDRALRSEASGLDSREHQLARAIVYAAVQRRETLAYWIEALTGRPASDLDLQVRIPLEIGLVQLAFLDRVPPHAAVDESVTLAKSVSNRGGERMVNAVLRRIVREGFPDLPSDRTPRGAAIVHSVPRWLAERWFAELGEEGARALLARCNEPAERAVRVNTLKSDPETVRDRLAVAAHGDPELPEALILDEAVDLESSDLWAEGAIVAQSRGAMLAGRILDPQAGERVLELCAAPGGKTSHLAALMGQGGTGITAVEQHRGRAEALRRTLDRLGAGGVRVVEGDALKPPAALKGQFDAILLDPPCAALGTLQRQPDVRWRATPESIDQLSILQERMVEATLPLLAPGGRLLYAVCSIGPQESDEVLSRTQATVESRRTVLPHIDHTDGFEYALLRQ